MNHGCGEMIPIHAVKQGKGLPENLCVAFWRQTVRLDPVEINHEANRRRVERPCRENAHKARFDHAPDRGRAARDDICALAVQCGPIIRDKLCPQRHQAQGKGRLAASRGTTDQDRLAGMGNAGCVADFGTVCLRGARHCQIGRPTTNRAPSGSDVRSASVGRIFSAQITPPCASTICFEMARPRPELLPKSSSGRCE